MLIKKISKIFYLKFFLFSFMKEDVKDAKKFLKEKKVPTNLLKKLLKA